MVLMCKMIISPGVFFIFLKFWLSGLLGGGQKGKKQPKMTKDSIFCTLHLRNHASFVVFSKFGLFVLLGGSKGKKWPKMTKTLFFALYIFITLYHMIFIYIHHMIMFFLLHKCEMIISPEVFFIFWKLWFFDFLGC